MNDCCCQGNWVRRSRSSKSQDFWLRRRRSGSCKSEPNLTGSRILDSHDNPIVVRKSAKPHNRIPRKSILSIRTAPQHSRTRDKSIQLTKMIISVIVYLMICFRINVNTIIHLAQKNITQIATNKTKRWATIDTVIWQWSVCSVLACYTSALHTGRTTPVVVLVALLANQQWGTVHAVGNWARYLSARASSKLISVVARCASSWGELIASRTTWRTGIACKNRWV